MTYIKFSILFLALFISNSSFSQDCTGGNAQIDLDINNVRARLHSSGSLWWDGSDGRYIYPKIEPGSGIPETAAIFAGGLWIGAKDPAGNLRLAASEYGLASGKTDYFPGPLNENGETTDNTCNNFDKFFMVTSQEIDTHIEDFQSDGVINGPVSDAILGWPGNGNPNFFSIHNFELPADNSYLAPYFDINGNGLYDPMEGDFPNTKNADQAIWWVFNDNGGLHTESQGSPLSFEIQMLAYSYSAADQAINDATFYDVKMINKSGQNLTDFYSSIWIDPDLGCYTDDYIGCIPDENIGFVYNMDELDGDNAACFCNVNTYCDEIPVVGVKLLRGLTSYESGSPVDLGMSSFMFYNNAGVSGGAHPATYDPGLPPEYYNYMQSIWTDGTSLTYGGNGYSPGGSVTDYAFAANPSDPTGWSMCTANLPPSDPRILMNSGPIDSPAGSIHKMSFAVIAQPNVPHPCPDVSGLIAIGNTVQDAYDMVTSTSEIVYESNKLTIQPNPFSEQTTFSFKAATELIQFARLYAIDGKLVRNYNNVQENSLTIHREELSKGMYIYSLVSTTGQMMTGKVMVK